MQTDQQLKIYEAAKHFGAAFTALAGAFAEDLKAAGVVVADIKTTLQPESQAQPQQEPEAKLEPKPKKASSKKTAESKASSLPDTSASTDSAHTSAPATQAVEKTASNNDFLDIEQTPVETPAKAVTIDESALREHLVKYAQKFDKDKAYAILAKYDGAKRVNELKPENFEKVYNDLDAGLK